MPEKKIISQKIAAKYVNNVPEDEAGHVVKYGVATHGSIEKKAGHKLQKTETERVAFIKVFADLVKANSKVKDNYLISFADVDYATQFYITDKDKKVIDFAQLLTKTEYIAYTDLTANWQK